MTAKQFTAALAELDLTKASAARFFDVSLRSVTNWCNDSGPPSPVAILTAYMLAKGVTPSEVSKAIGEPGPHRPTTRR